MSKVCNGYEMTYEAQRQRLLTLNFPEAAARLGFTLLYDDMMTVTFAGRLFVLTRAGVYPADGLAASANTRTVLVCYAYSQGDVPPSGNFTLLRNFTAGLQTGTLSASGQGGDWLNQNWMTTPLSRAFAGRYDAFCAAATRVGLTFKGSRTSGEYTWEGLLLPRIPVRLVYYEEDDEFPCKVDVFFDTTAPQYFNFEPLAVLQHCFVRALADAPSEGF
jgi:hypothetical protein